MRHVHVDACWIQDYIWSEGREYQEADDLFRNNIYPDIYNNHIQIKVSQLAVGELVNNYCRDELEDEDCNFDDLYGFINRYEVDLIPPSIGDYSLAIDIMEDDREIEHTDAVLISQSLNDPVSSHFLTQDQPVLHSNTIKEKSKVLEENGERERKIFIANEY